MCCGEFEFLPALSHEVEDRSGSGVINDEVSCNSGAQGSQQSDALARPATTQSRRGMRCNWKGANPVALLLNSTS